MMFTATHIRRGAAISIVDTSYECSLLMVNDVTMVDHVQSRREVICGPKHSVLPRSGTNEFEYAITRRVRRWWLHRSSERRS